MHQDNSQPVAQIESYKGTKKRIISVWQGKKLKYVKEIRFLGLTLYSSPVERRDQATKYRSLLAATQAAVRLGYYVQSVR